MGRPTVGDLVQFLVAVKRDAARFTRAVERMDLQSKALVECPDGLDFEARACRDEQRERRGPVVGRRMREVVLIHERHAVKHSRSVPAGVRRELERHERFAEHDRRP